MLCSWGHCATPFLAHGVRHITNEDSKELRIMPRRSLGNAGTRAQSSGRDPLVFAPTERFTNQRSEITVNRKKEPITPEATTPTTEAPSELQEDIRRRAYELYEQRGGEDGRELEDWLQAEAEVTQSTKKAMAA